MRPVAICIPARNEAENLSRLMDALAGQERGAEHSFALCLFLDGCGDESREILASHADTAPFPVRYRVGTAGVANAGRARREAMALGIEVLAGSDGLLLTTDADGVPAANWIVRACAALREADVVAGRIVRLPHPPSARQDRLELYYDRLFALRRQIDPVAWEAEEPHHCTGGANLGFTAAAYAALGGFQPLAQGEDARIVDDAARLGLRVRRDPACIVHTSARRQGRIAGGFADALRQQDRSTETLVGDPRGSIWQYRRQAEARRAFEDGRATDIAASIGLSTDHVLGVARDCPNAEAFAMRIVPAPPDAARTIPLERAEAVLAMVEAERLDIVA